MQRHILILLLTLLALLTATAAFAADLGQRELAGVRALARLEPAGGSHQLLVTFNAIEANRPLTRGLVAVKVTGPEGKQAPAQKLELVNGRFVGNLNLPARGEYRLLVACRLHDGRKRQFSFRYQRP